MKEKLIIKNFGPIKFVELELGKINVLIGENATGKSIVAKVLAVCQYFSYLLVDDDLFPNAFEEGLNSRGLNEFIQNNSYFFYECEHYSFVAERGLKKETERDDLDGTIIAEYDIPAFFSELKSKSNHFQNLLNELDAIKPKLEGYGYYYLLGWTIPTSFFQNDVSAVLNNPFYVPTERGLQSIFSLGKNSIQNLSDALFNQLAELDQIARYFKNETRIEPLDISYKNENGKGYIKKNTEEKYYSLFNAASGYQSTIPVVLLVKYYTEIKKKSKTFIIEEPELNLFPVSQNKLMQYLVDKTMNYGNSLLLTTHSPYTLTSINNLIYAFNVGQSHDEEIGHIVEKKYWLNPADISAYRLLGDGTAKNIVDKEMNLIEAGELDEVSRNLNEVFEDISDVEFSTVNESQYK